MRFGRTASEVDSTHLELHDEEKIIRDKSTLGPDLDRGKVDGSQHVPVRLKEGLPRRLVFSFGHWLHCLHSSWNGSDSLSQSARDGRLQVGVEKFVMPNLLNALPSNKLLGNEASLT